MANVNVSSALILLLVMIVLLFSSTPGSEALCKISDDGTKVTCRMKIGDNDTTLTFTVEKCGVLTLWVYVKVQTSVLSWKSSTSHGSPTYFHIPSSYRRQLPLFRSDNETFKLELYVALYRTKTDPRLQFKLNYVYSNNNRLTNKGPGQILNNVLPIYCTKVVISFKEPCRITASGGKTEIRCKIAMGHNATSLIMKIDKCSTTNTTYNFDAIAKTSYTSVKFSKESVPLEKKFFFFVPQTEYPLFRIGNTTFRALFFVMLHKENSDFRLKVTLLYGIRHGGEDKIDNFINVPIKCGSWWYNLHTGLKVLVIGGPILFIVLLIIVIVWCYRKKVSKSRVITEVKFQNED